ncbi:substrate-binding periplasmic protein [Fundidesulfovibrio terrae]|uniref:substrate-binding periplasmic protein n=1 Tax=Fundidesulfovibrio terrae TaxID=2922866 RepID=UPI001FAE95B8|nr:transporter substrate-binding domain-containing protein [Fundidesulfovibrio terrae]
MPRAILTLLAVSAAVCALPRLALSGPLKVYYFERPPYYATLEAQPSGFLIHRTREILTEAGLEFEFQSMPARRILQELATGETSACAVGWFKTPERERLYKFSLPIYQDMPMLAVFLKSGKQPPAATSTFTRLATEKDLTLGIIESFSYGPKTDALLAAMPIPPMRVQGSQEQLMRMLAARRFDYMLVNPEEANTLACLAGLAPDDIVQLPLSDLPKGNTRYLMFSKATGDETIQRINAAITKLGVVPRRAR